MRYICKIIISDVSTEDIKPEHELKPLDLGTGCTIEYREEDGYINVTNLCKAGKKEFKAWNRLQRTKAFLKELSSSVTISTDALIKYQSGQNSDRSTWVHPQVAVNIAQWISPQFDVKVSAWVYEVMMTGKVDITNIKSYREIQRENKDKQLRIEYLTKKYVRKQPRKVFESNVIYMLTTPSLKKDRRYIVGKASNLTNRLSTYNKTDEHEVVYYQSCEDEETMSIAETLVLRKLLRYREQANRDRFILPDGKDISLFIDVIKNNIENIS